jgi:hypothetical protein
MLGMLRLMDCAIQSSRFSSVIMSRVTVALSSSAVGRAMLGRDLLIVEIHDLVVHDLHGCREPINNQYGRMYDLWSTVWDDFWYVSHQSICYAFILQ